jgi:Leucine-rich repeat (LRR) protein
LESLAVNGNDLTSIPDTLLTLPKLNYLLIRENDFDESEIKETIEKFEQKGVTVQYE